MNMTEVINKITCKQHPTFNSRINGFGKKLSVRSVNAGPMLIYRSFMRWL